MSKIGKIYPTYMQYFCRIEKRELKKSRPVLIIQEPSALDMEYTVLPISTVSKKQFFHPLFDIPLHPSLYPKLFVNRVCYIRSHKQTLVYRNSIDFKHCFGDLIQDYPCLFEDVIQAMKQYDLFKIQMMKKFT